MPYPYSIRLDHALVDDLRQLARQRSLQERRDVTWIDLIRESARRLLNEESRRRPATTKTPNKNGE